MLLACFATFLFTSSKAAKLGCAGTSGGLLVMEDSGSNEDKVPMLDKAAVTVAIRQKQRQIKKMTEANENQVQSQHLLSEETVMPAYKKNYLGQYQ